MIVYLSNPVYLLCYYLYLSVHNLLASMEPTPNLASSSSFRRRKRTVRQQKYKLTTEPILTTPEATQKYQAIKNFIVSGLCVIFDEFPILLEHIKNAGWECLFVFDHEVIFPQLLFEFYSHLEFLRNDEGLLLGIRTFVQGEEIYLDEELLVEILGLGEDALTKTRFNGYLTPFTTNDSDCYIFKESLSFVSKQPVPVPLLDKPTYIGIEFLTPEYQFLGHLLRKNVMPFRFNKLMYPYDLLLMTNIMIGYMDINLPHFILSSIEYCHSNNCIGFGLLLTRVFKFLHFDSEKIFAQKIYKYSLQNELIPFPKSLFTFQSSELVDVPISLPIDHQLKNLMDMQQALAIQQDQCNKNVEELKLKVEGNSEKLQEILDLLKAQNNNNIPFLDIPFPSSPTIPPLSSIHIPDLDATDLNAI